MIALAIAAAVATSDTSTWFIVNANRESLIAVDTNAIKLGASGAQASFLTITADPAPGRPTVILIRSEFDCFAKKMRFTGTATIDAGSSDTKLKEHVTGWEAPPSGSNLDDMLKVECDGPSAIPSSWVEFNLSTAALVEFYFTKILGRVSPIK